MTDDLLKYLARADHPVTLQELSATFGPRAASAVLMEDGVTLDESGETLQLTSDAVARGQQAQSVLDVTEASPENVRAFVAAMSNYGETVLRGQLYAQFGRDAVDALLPIQGLQFAPDGAVWLTEAA